MPVVTLAGLQLAQVFSGAVLVETVFSLPGVGPLLYESIVRRDFPVILGVLFGAATTTIVANIITDIIYSWMDQGLNRFHEPDRAEIRKYNI